MYVINGIPEFRKNRNRVAGDQLGSWFSFSLSRLSFVLVALGREKVSRVALVVVGRR